MIWYVAIGSAVGGVSRYLLGGLVQRAAGTAFPLGTLAINVTGAFVIGIVLRLAADGTVSPEMRALLAVGFCGGYTTFSAFSAETLAMAEGGQAGRALLYVAASVLLSLGATLAGAVLASRR